MRDGTADLPSLANATQVLLSASSDASIWVTFAADRLAAELRAIAGNNVDVRILIDGYFEPSMDSAGRYHQAAPANFNLFDNGYIQTGLCVLPDNSDGVSNESCSDLNYQPGPLPNGKTAYYDTLNARGVLRDESCEKMHGVDAPICYDKLHTLLHHLDIPFFVLADQEDATVSGAPLQYADDSSYTWQNPETYRTRILDQAYDVQNFWDTSSREEGAGTPGNAVLILPKSRRDGEPWGKAQHVRFGDDAEMLKKMTRCTSQGTEVASAAFGQALFMWTQDMLPVQFVFEDGQSWDGSSDYWITGSTCDPPQ